MKYDDIKSVLEGLKKAQDAERDQRNNAREAQLFVTKRDGQWEPYVWERLNGRFRGTFDMCNPIVDSIAGEIEQSDFTLRVSPASGESSEDTARTYDGLIRNIRNMSNAEYAFDKCARANIVQGFDAVEVIQDYVNPDSFDQDLLIKRIPDAVDSVWFDLGSTEQSRSDAKWAVVLDALPIDEYEKMFPEGSRTSVGTDQHCEAYWQKAEVVVVGRILFKKETKIDLVKMSDGSVYEDDDEFKSVADELAQQGIVEEDRRVKKSSTVYSRMFDGSDFLTEEEETVFSIIPIVPIYGNFDIVENKIVYSGKIEKLYDEQRALNYAMSRDIEDGAISPSPTVWMTEEMAEGHDYSNMNTDRAGVRFFNLDSENTSLTPQYTGGPQSSPGLQTTIANMQQMISASSGTFNAQQGNASPTQSGVAGAAQIDQGNLVNTKWFKSLEVMICQVGKVLIDAIPRVYDVKRQVRIVGEDGTGKITTINDVVLDVQSGREIELNNLTKGQYDVVCETGPAFNNQQKEAVQAFLDAAAVDPTILQGNADLWLKNHQSPIMRDAAERSRTMLFNQGLIPEEQWTDEERQKVAEQQALAAQQPPQEDPNMVLARAEEGKAIAEQTNAQTKQFETQTNQRLKAEELQLERQKIELDIAKFQREKDDKFNVEAAKINQGQQKLDQDQQKIDLQAQAQQMQMLMDSQKMIVESLNKQADTLNKLKDAMGADAIISPSGAQAYQEQTEIIQDSQENQNAT